MATIISYVVSFIIGFLLSYVLFYKSLKKKYSKAWAVTNVVIWGSVLSYVLILVIHMLFFINE